VERNSPEFHAAFGRRHDEFFEAVKVDAKSGSHYEKANHVDRGCRNLRHAGLRCMEVKS